jgi:hypothetical protein
LKDLLIASCKPGGKGLVDYALNLFLSSFLEILVIDTFRYADLADGGPHPLVALSKCKIIVGKAKKEEEP